MNMLKFLMIVMACLVFSGCTHNPARSSNIPDSEALIAQDMVNVLVQIKELPAATSTLYFPSLHSGNDRFSAMLGEKFKDAGYAVRTAGINPGEAVVSYMLSRNMDPQHGAISTYTVSIGSISVRRTYVTTDDNHVRPLAPMQIKGTSAADLRLDNQLFEGQGAAGKLQHDVDVKSGETLPEDYLPPLIQPETTAEALSLASNTDQRPLVQDAAQAPPSSIGQVIEPSLLNIVAPATYSVTGQGSESNALRGLSNEPTRNVRELGQSNFADVFAKLAIVKETILTFDNDSVRMGSVNKIRVSELVDLFNGATDVFSVIGCSNGATRLAIGQEGLALGRAERVREELLFAGVPSENILDEGCWAGDYYDERMPRRGVVLSLKRRPA